MYSNNLIFNFEKSYITVFITWLSDIKWLTLTIDGDPVSVFPTDISF